MTLQTRHSANGSSNVRQHAGWEAAPAPFRSILWPGSDGPADIEAAKEPACFHDLYLDRIVSAVTRGRPDAGLAAFLYVPLEDPDAVHYRQEVMRDLDGTSLLEHLETFVAAMNSVLSYEELGDRASCKQAREFWFLDAVTTYCDALESLHRRLGDSGPASRGLLAFQVYLEEYLQSPRIRTLVDEAEGIRASFSEIRYCLHFKGNTITVSRYQGESDYAEEVAATLESFRSGAGGDHRVKGLDHQAMGDVEARIVGHLAQLFPKRFESLEVFCRRRAEYRDAKIVRFTREIQFYLAYLNHIAGLRRAGLTFCYPSITSDPGAAECLESFDLALAERLVAESRTVVCNDFHLDSPERILVVTGANQGGKTTFARMFGQVHFLASLGCPVPGRRARLFLPDRIFSHFEKQERVDDIQGKLRDDLARIGRILEQATSRSIVIMNEIMASTTTHDALRLSQRVLERLFELSVTGVFVTFLDELSVLSEKTVSVVSSVDPSDPEIRTFKLRRRRADGAAYALSIADKYRLTSRWLKERLGP